MANDSNQEQREEEKKEEEKKEEAKDVTTSVNSSSDKPLSDLYLEQSKDNDNDDEFCQLTYDDDDDETTVCQVNNDSLKPSISITALSDKQSQSVALT